MNRSPLETKRAFKVILIFVILKERILRLKTLEILRPPSNPWGFMMTFESKFCYFIG